VGAPEPALSEVEGFALRLFGANLGHVYFEQVSCAVQALYPFLSSRAERPKEA